MGVQEVQSRIASLNAMMQRWNPQPATNRAGGYGVAAGMLGSNGPGSSVDTGNSDFDAALANALGNATPSAGGYSPVGTQTRSATTSAAALVQTAMGQQGKAYIWGASASPSDPSPRGFDCSELVQWSSQRLGVGSVPRTAAEQWEYCKRNGTTMSVEQALRTPGALVFRVGAGGTNHVAISLGDGHRLIEARGQKYGVGVFDADGRTWTGAGRLPGVSY